MHSNWFCFINRKNESRPNRATASKRAFAFNFIFRSYWLSTSIEQSMLTFAKRAGVKFNQIIEYTKIVVRKPQQKPIADDWWLCRHDSNFFYSDRLINFNECKLPPIRVPFILYFFFIVRQNQFIKNLLWLSCSLCLTSNLLIWTR